MTDAAKDNTMLNAPSTAKAMSRRRALLGCGAALTGAAALAAPAIAQGAMGPALIFAIVRGNKPGLST